MATCYICGKSHAEYRRTVQTGNSNRVGVSSRGRMSTFTTAHYGVRTVCAKCALEIDYKNKKNAGAWGIVLGVFVGVGAIGIMIILPEYQIMGIIGIIASVLLGYLPTSSAHKKAAVWYSENSDKYIDSYDLDQQIKLQQKNLKQVENRNRKRDMFQEMGNAFGARIEQELKLLYSKADLLKATFNDKTINTVEESDKILETVKKLESETKLQGKELQNLCNETIKNLKKFDFDQKFLDDFILSVEEVRVQASNAINEFINEIKSAENQLIQGKTTLLKGEN